MKGNRLLAILALGLAVILGLPLAWGAEPSSANHTVNSFHVNSFADASDLERGDGVCDDGTGKCTLRAAIQESNALAGLDAVILPAGVYDLTVAGENENAAATGDLDITDDLTIAGAGADVTIVDAGALSDRVFHILTGAVVISDVTIRRGNAVENGGGIWNESALTLIDVTLLNNVAQSGGGVGNFNTDGHVATLIMIDSRVLGNTATYNGGGIANSEHSHLSLVNSAIGYNKSIFQGGGGIESTGVMTITSSIISRNIAECAGGINMGGGNAALVNAIVSNNTARQNTGGIFNAGHLQLTRCTIRHNIAGSESEHGDGGGIFNSRTLVMNGTTVSDNVADGLWAEGGGIVNDIEGDLTLVNSTVSGNTAGSSVLGGGGILNLGALFLENSTVSNNKALLDGGGIDNRTGTVILKNTIVARNQGRDCYGTIVSWGHNLDSDSTCQLTNSGDLPGLDPRLGLLQYNGGSTKTHALLPGSPARDAGSDDCPPPDTDQRTVPRPQGTRCDIGAYEAVVWSLP
jgi:CSLREA domain-containing protein